MMHPDADIGPDGRIEESAVQASVDRAFATPAKHVEQREGETDEDFVARSHAESQATWNPDCPYGDNAIGKAWHEGYLRACKDNATSAAPTGVGIEKSMAPMTAFRPNGLLWYINRVAFHPRGFALAFDVEDDTGEIKGWCLKGNGSETFFFPAEHDDEGLALVEALFARARAENP